MKLGQGLKDIYTAAHCSRSSSTRGCSFESDCGDHDAIGPGALAAVRHPRSAWSTLPAPMFGFARSDPTTADALPLKHRPANRTDSRGRAERRLHHLPHQDRRSDDAPDGHGDARVRGLSRRRRRVRAPQAPATRPDASYQRAEEDGAPAAARCGSWQSASESRARVHGVARESHDYIQFVNPGDLRVADAPAARATRPKCGTCAPA